MQPTRDNRGLLPAGSPTELGTVVRQTDTAYLIEDDQGVYWVSFDRVHGSPVPVLDPMVVL